MDDYTTKHLQAWADTALHEDERDELVRKMTAYVDRYPEVIQLHTFSWPVIRSVVEELDS
ncbi:hypothetical protein LCGC14_2760510 [marine sediment metagenome]|uniref:Uncharacterized protein n=1 Tax=marine sediment metagenome TaxID=412755 RepID=A0A0F8YZ25_9ZZZZ